MALFKRGYEVNRENQERQDRARENAGKKLFDFFLSNDKEEADVRFLTEEPINFMMHTIKRSEKEYDNYTCTGENCPLCANGDKPKDKGAYLIVDRRKFEYTDKNGNKKSGSNQVKMYIQGTRTVSQLDRLSSKYGITNRDLTIVRLGKGTSTTYTIERGDEEKLSSDEISKLLPENIKEKYDGTMESLYSVVEEQLMMRAKDYVAEDDSTEEEVSSSANGIVSIEDEPTKKKSLFKSRPQNSIKPTAKDLLK